MGKFSIIKFDMASVGCMFNLEKGWEEPGGRESKAGCVLFDMGMNPLKIW
jgi:hypothetical protein